MRLLFPWGHRFCDILSSCGKFAASTFRISILCIYFSHIDTQNSQELTTVSLPIPRDSWKIVLDFILCWFSCYRLYHSVFLCKVNRKKKILKKRAGNNTTFGFIAAIKYLLLHGNLYAEFQYAVISVRLSL